MAKLLATLLVLFALYHSGLALKCYSCNSNMVSGCADPPTLGSISLTECNVPKTGPVNMASCMKIIIEDKATSKTNTTRRCVTHIKDDSPCKKAESDLKPEAKLQFCDICETDGCNSAGIVSGSVAIVFFIGLVALANIYFTA